LYKEIFEKKISYLYSKRLSAKQCIAHPWLTRRPKSISKPSDEETAEKKLSTKKLRRFVIRRRWQVKLFSIKIFYFIFFLIRILFLESGQCFISIATYGNDVVNKYDTTRFASFFFFYLFISITQTYFLFCLFVCFFLSRASFTHCLLYYIWSSVYHIDWIFSCLFVFIFLFSRCCYLWFDSICSPRE
jgi:hypothetical protein